mmetsp:Transcript_33598/g.51721  ORF Transcript_33598/g.51721 Transcript_33598/m.51721 type:complete len:108 (+) Transcript_33598:9069-9392(+)
MKMQLMGIGLSIMNKIKQQKKMKLSVKKDVSNFDFRTGEKGETIAVPKTLNEQKERHSHGITGTTIPALRFGRLATKSEDNNSDATSENYTSPNIKASMLNLDSIFN